MQIKQTKQTWLITTCLLILAGSVSPALATGPRLDRLTLNCVGATQDSILLEICAGETGAPAGFVVQWAVLEDDIDCDDFDWPRGPDYCRASFRVTRRCQTYNLDPNECVVVEIGNLAGAPCRITVNDCGGLSLACGTQYVFRASAMATADLRRSRWSQNTCCETEDCGCTYTQGFWKTHPEDWPDLTGGCSCTGGDGLCLGENCYSQTALLDIFAQSAQGNALLILGHQLIATKLNALTGAGDSQPLLDPNDPNNPYTGLTASEVVAVADDLIGTLDVGSDEEPPSSPLGSQMTSAAALLNEYNNGRGGVPHCD